MFHLSTEETLPTLVVGVSGPCVFWGGFVCLFVCVGAFWVASPTNMQSFQSFNDDLGTAHMASALVEKKGSTSTCLRSGT